jgi:hypothetical protein
MAENSHIPEHGLSKRRSSGQEREINTQEEGEISDIAKKEGMDYAEINNKVIQPKKMVVGETGPELSSDEELRAHYKKP